MFILLSNTQNLSREGVKNVGRKSILKKRRIDTQRNIDYINGNR